MATLRRKPGAVIGVALASLALAGAALVWVLSNQVSGESVIPLSRSGADMAIVVGGGSRKGDAVIIDRFDGNIAIASTGLIDRSADHAALVHLRARGSNRRDVTLFWRRAESGDLFRATLPGLGDAYVDLRGEPGWGGRVSELGIVFYDDGGSVELQSLSAEPATLGGLLKLTLADWRWQNRWNQQSVHWIEAGQGQATVPLALFVLGWLLAAALFCALLSRRIAGLAVFLPIAVLCWMTMDMRWLVNRASQAKQTLDEYAGDRRGSLRFGDDEVTRRAVEKAVCDMPAADNSGSGRLIIASNSRQDMRFQILRGKYHALPVPVYVHEGDLASLPRNLADRVLLLKQRYFAEGGDSGVSSADALAALNKRGLQARLAWEDEDAFMLLLRDSPARSGCGE